MSGSRRTVTAITMTGLFVVLVLMAVLGANLLTASSDDSGDASDKPSCPPDRVITKSTVKRSEVTVSVYNAGDDKGAAQDLMSRLEKAGFRAGEVGNAPTDLHVDGRAAVYVSRVADETDALLVVRLLGKGVPIRHTDEDYGPGVDVFIGESIGKLNPKAPRAVKLPEPITSCDTSS